MTSPLEPWLAEEDLDALRDETFPGFAEQLLPACGLPVTSTAGSTADVGRAGRPAEASPSGAGDADG